MAQKANAHSGKIISTQLVIISVLVYLIVLDYQSIQEINKQNASTGQEHHVKMKALKLKAVSTNAISANSKKEETKNIKVEQVEKAEIAEKDKNNEKVDKLVKVETAKKPGLAVKEKKQEKLEKVEKVEKVEKAAKPEEAGKVENKEMVKKAETEALLIVVNPKKFKLPAIRSPCFPNPEVSLVDLRPENYVGLDKVRLKDLIKLKVKFIQRIKTRKTSIASKSLSKNFKFSLVPVGKKHALALRDRQAYLS